MSPIPPQADSRMARLSRLTGVVAFSSRSIDGSIWRRRVTFSLSRWGRIRMREASGAPRNVGREGKLLPPQTVEDFGGLIAGMLRVLSARASLWGNAGFLNVSMRCNRTKGFCAPSIQLGGFDLLRNQSRQSWGSGIVLAVHG